MGPHGFVCGVLPVFYVSCDVLELAQAFSFGHVGIKLHFDGRPHLAYGP